MKYAGFTLVELMIVVAIIGILAAVAVPVYSKYVDDSIKAEANVNLADLAAKNEAYFRTWNRYVSACGNNFFTAAHTGKQATNCGDGGLTRLGFNPGPSYWTYGIAANSNSYTIGAARLTSNNASSFVVAKIISSNKKNIVYQQGASARKALDPGVY